MAKVLLILNPGISSTAYARDASTSATFPAFDLLFELPADPPVVCRGRFLLDVRWESWPESALGHLQALARY